MKLLFNESQPLEISSNSDEDNFEISNPQDRDGSLECKNSVEIIFNSYSLNSPFIRKILIVQLKRRLSLSVFL